MQVFIRYKTVFYLMKTCVVETLYHYNHCLLHECSKPLMTIHIVWLQVYIPYLLKLMPRLLLCLCLERCRRLFEGGYCSRVANIYHVHVHYCPHGKLMQVDEAFCFASIVRRQLVYKTVWTPFLGEILIATPEPKNNHNRHAVCVKKDGEIVGHVPGIECSLLYSSHFHAAVHTMSSHLEVSSPHPWQLLWMLLNLVLIRGRLLNGVWRLFK